MHFSNSGCIQHRSSLSASRLGINADWSSPEFAVRLQASYSCFIVKFEASEHLLIFEFSTRKQDDTAPSRHMTGISLFEIG